MRKRILAILLAAVLLISLSLMAAWAQETPGDEDLSCYLHGDINSDGVIDGKDAVYTLFHSIPLFQEQYPVDQDCDFNKDSHVNSKDAIHLMYASMPEHALEYPLDGTIHRYSEPVWEWTATADEASVKATMHCSCGQSLTVTSEELGGIKITTGTVVEATCTTGGSKEYVGRITCGNEIYVSSKTVDIPAGDGHVFDATTGCEEEAICLNCDFETPAKGHTWVLNESKSTAATCTENAVQWYDCACGETKQMEVANSAAHQYVYDKVVKVEGCQYAKQYKCEVEGCGHEIVDENSTFDRHTYTVTMDPNNEPNCTYGGVKTFTCQCGHSYNEDVAANGVHVWNSNPDNSSTGTNGVSTYTCKYCDATKTVVSVQDQPVNKDVLASAGEVKLENNASIALDSATLDGLDDDKSIVLSVTEVTADNTGLTEQQKEQVGQNPVYDFTMKYDDGDKITDFSGKVTVSLPYEPADGEDVDCIDVWYIADDGSLEQMKATYSNGFVTFETDHFSYYTVTRLTAAERCALYGHMDTTVTTDVSCTSDGYTLKSCQRCGRTEKTNVITKTGHNYQLTANSNAATCTSEGLKEEQCQNCQHTKSQTLPATGHKITYRAAESEPATCTAEGKEHYACDCGFGYDVTVMQLAHKYTSANVVAPTCGNKGYEVFACSGCGKEDIRNEKAALGHNYNVAKNGWTWSDDYSQATLKLVCKNDSTHEKILNAVVTQKSENSVCMGGTITYTATTSFNLVNYTDTVTAQADAPGHLPSNRWSIEGDNHYHICMTCGEKTDVAAHTMEKSVVKEPTCIAAGVSAETCTVCGVQETAEIPATGLHSYKNGVCQQCGLTESGCDHKYSQTISINPADYGACAGKIVISSCACGQEQSLDLYGVSCMWSDSEWETITLPDGTSADYYTKTCLLCGAVHESTGYHAPTGNGCEAWMIENIKQTIGGASIMDVTMKYEKLEHPTLNSITYDLKDYGMCGGSAHVFSCACGERSDYYYDLSCESVYNEETGVEVCSKCNTERILSDFGGMQGCVYRDQYSCTFRRNGKVLLKLEGKRLFQEHWYEVTDYKLLGKTCEDGILLTQVCKNCGQTDTYETDYHADINRKVMDLSGFGFCFDEITVYTCPCPEAYTGFYTSGDGYCSWSWSEESDATCVTCKGKRHTEETVLSKDEYCNAQIGEVTTFTDSQGRQFVVETKGDETIHDYEVSYELLGESCEDGVSELRVCKDCGSANRHTYYYHYSIYETYDLSEYGGCNTVIETSECLCGENSGWGWSNHNCDFEYDGETENSSVYTCENCGISYEQSYSGNTWIDSCQYTYTWTRTFFKGEKVLFRIEEKGTGSNHQEIHTLTLNEGATSCEDGYHVTSVCAVCGKQIDDYYSSGDHGTYTVERELLYKNSTCGDIYLAKNACACGQREGSYISYSGEGCNWSWNGWQNGYEVETCQTCGLVRKYNSTSERIQGETCKYYDIGNFVFERDGKTVAAAQTTSTFTSHQEEYTYQLFGDSCEDGYAYTVTCRLCDHTDSGQYEAGEADHWTYPVQYIDLSAYGTCGGYVEVYQCACGRDGHINNNYNCDRWRTLENWTDTDLNGVEYHYYTRACRKCGLQRAEVSYKSDIDACHYSQVQRVTYSIAGTEIETVEINDIYTSHNHEIVSAEMEPGAASCEDGVYLVYRCVDCGDETTGYGYDHYTFETESVDLSAYGAICGAKLVLKKCACGEQCSYDFSHDTQCDLDKQEIECWIDNYLYTYQENSEGGYGIYSYAYLYTCAVTDPEACGLSIRQSTYWLQEGCEAVQYQVWQLGYDRQTGTCQKELKIATGERKAYHNYDEEYTRTGDSGNYKNVWNYTCPDCGSYYIDTDTYVNDCHVKSEWVAVNTLNNGENKERRVVHEYASYLGANGDYFSLATYEKYSYIYADGSAYWYSYTYDRDPNAPCNYVYTYSNSNGHTETYESSGHNTWWRSEITKQPTCTQHGEEHEYWYCPICGVVTDEWNNSVDPTAHNWNWNEDKQMYVCADCGLESENGASGEMVLEDMTDAYGNGTSYVVGYWNRGGIQTHTYISVILDDADEANKELVLSDINFQYLSVKEDGIRAVAFNQAEALAKAAEKIAEAGYTGSYAIRISFVPINGSDTLDYAITFDSLVAE